MSKYLANDVDYKMLNDAQRAGFETYMLEYDVDANAETSKSKDVISFIWDIVRGKRGLMSAKIQSPADVYTLIFTILVGLDVVLTTLVVLFMVFYVIFWILTMDSKFKLYAKISFKFILFVLLCVSLVAFVSFLIDKLQENIEKIVFKL